MRLVRTRRSLRRVPRQRSARSRSSGLAEGALPGLRAALGLLHARPRHPHGVEKTAAPVVPRCSVLVHARHNRVDLGEAPDGEVPAMEAAGRGPNALSVKTPMSWQPSSQILAWMSSGILA
eukprot:9641923-Lingulodinium_polyedra.AAC.1